MVAKYGWPKFALHISNNSFGIGSESYQHSEPLVTGSKWHQILVDEGFTGNDLELKDFEDENCSKLSSILSIALADPPMDNINRINHEIVLITPGLLSAEADIERSRDYLESQRYRSTQVNPLEKAIAVKSDVQKRTFLRMMELSNHF